jgi:hypothetical protein
MAASALLLAGCGQTPVPKPKGYFRIDLPEKSYVQYDSPCSYSIEYPHYAVVNLHPAAATDTCWMDIEFPSLKAKIHLTYFDIHDNLATADRDVTGDGIQTYHQGRSHRGETVGR